MALAFRNPPKWRRGGKGSVSPRILQGGERGMSVNWHPVVEETGEVMETT
jgi:hypothetical protein